MSKNHLAFVSFLGGILLAGCSHLCPVIENHHVDSDHDNIPDAWDCIVGTLGDLPRGPAFELITQVDGRRAINCPDRHRHQITLASLPTGAPGASPLPLLTFEYRRRPIVLREIIGNLPDACDPSTCPEPQAGGEQCTCSRDCRQKLFACRGVASPGDEDPDLPGSQPGSFPTDPFCERQYLFCRFSCLNETGSEPCNDGNACTGPDTCGTAGSCSGRRRLAGDSCDLGPNYCGAQCIEDQGDPAKVSCQGHALVACTTIPGNCDFEVSGREICESDGSWLCKPRVGSYCIGGPEACDIPGCGTCNGRLCGADSDCVEGSRCADSSHALCQNGHLERCCVPMDCDGPSDGACPGKSKCNSVTARSLICPDDPQRENVNACCWIPDGVCYRPKS